MNRTSRRDLTLDGLNDERDQAAIEVSLAWDADPPDLVRLAELQRQIKGVKLRIYHHKPAEA
jgi:hypothetical protein